jgi:hypothetical protein
MAFKFAETLSDGSKVFNVGISMERGHDIVVACIDEDAADNLVAVWEHGVISVDLVRDLPYETDNHSAPMPDGAAYLED